MKPLYTPDQAAVRLFNILGGDMANKVMREMVTDTIYGTPERWYWHQVGRALSIILNHERIHKLLGDDAGRFVCNDYFREH